MGVSKPLAVTTFKLPDLESYCDTFPATYHKNGDAISAESVKWFENGCRNFTEETRRRLYGLKGGQLVAYCYPDCDDEHLRVICDCMNFLFHLDDISDDMMTKDTEVLNDIVLNALWFPQFYRPTHAKGKEQPDEEPDASKLGRESVPVDDIIATDTHLLRSYSFWTRCIQDAGPGVQARFRETMELYLEAVTREARYRDNGVTPDLKSYMTIRRNTSGVKPCLDLLEYGFGIDLPDFVANDPTLKTLKQTADDFIAWANVCVHYS
jgi:hypothetical protein